MAHASRPEAPAALLEHPALFQSFPTSLATWVAPVDMRATQAQVNTFRGYAHAGDPLADALVQEMRGQPGGSGRRDFELALERGLAAVAAPGPALKAFFEQVEAVPVWLDPHKMRLGAETVQRTGIVGAYGALVDVSLMGGYLSQKALKVLVRTGEIDAMAPRRIAETALWWMEVTDPGGMARFAPGFKDTLRVRLIHAQIRAAMARRADWNAVAWDAPINQPQMAGTQLLFGLVGLLGLRVMGFRFTTDEIDAVIHLWRYIGLLSGVHADLLPASEADAWRLLWLLAATEFQPDADSQRLASALSKALPALHGVRGGSGLASLAARGVVAYHSTLSRLVLGNRNGDALGLPRHPAFLLPVLAGSALIFAGETARRHVPGATRLCTRLGLGSRRLFVRQLAPALRPDRSYARTAEGGDALACPHAPGRDVPAAASLSL